MCKVCRRKYTPTSREVGYAEQMRQAALRLYVDGMNLRRIGRHLGIHHRTVSDWVKAYAENLPDAPVPEKVDIAEMDEIFTFIGDKKTEST